MANKFKEKQFLAEILEELYTLVDEKEAGVKRDYKIIGKEDEQAKDWKTGELLWEDEEHIIPKMRDKWGYADKEELTEDDKLRIKVYQSVKAQLEKML